jgi:hypothetical protein
MNCMFMGRVAVCGACGKGQHQQRSKSKSKPQIGITDGIVNVFREYFNYVALYLFVIQR